jgi:RNA polymerase sigma-70 factor (ECF subfamily)
MCAVAEDHELIDRLNQGDCDALRRIYEKFKDDLMRIGICMLANRADAEDSLHDLFVSLTANSARVRPDGNLKGYLVTAMANRSRDRLRKRKRGHEMSEMVSGNGDEMVANVVDPAAAIVERETGDRLYRAITALPAPQRTVITLRLHGEMTFEEIAQQEGTSNNTIRSRYRYGLEKLRSLLSVGVEQ